ncbi:MAG: hypothetical protein R3Y54_04015 [Eubacteriales bacterium]
MFRLWAKIWKDNHLLQDTVICNDENDTRTHKIMGAIESFCYDTNLEIPIWLDTNITAFKRFNRVRFTQDNFIETIDYDYLEIEILEED